MRSVVLSGPTMLHEMIHRRRASFRVFCCLWARRLFSGLLYMGDRLVLHEMAHRHRACVCGPGCHSLVLCILGIVLHEMIHRYSVSAIGLVFVDQAVILWPWLVSLA